MSGAAADTTGPPWEMLTVTLPQVFCFASRPSAAHLQYKLQSHCNFSVTMDFDKQQAAVAEGAGLQMQLTSHVPQAAYELLLLAREASGNAVSISTAAAHHAEARVHALWQRLYAGT